MSDLRYKLIRLAQANPTLRTDLLPLLKQASGPRLDAGTKSKINRQLTDLTTPGHKTYYFDKIPLKDILAILNRYGVVMLQEDNTPWSGLLLGNDYEDNFILAPASFEKPANYVPYQNAMLRMSWHKMPSGKYEIVAYVS